MGNLGLRAGLISYYNVFGWSGVVAGIGVRTIGWPRVISTRPEGFRHRFSLRARTSDERVYNDVLCRNAYALDISPAPKVILDAGANIGATTVFFANRYPNAKILAVEPEPSNFALLVRNVRRYSNVVPVRAALWNRDGEIAVSEADSDGEVSGHWAFVTREGEGGQRVRAITIESLLRETGTPSIDLAKVDIEGAEQEVFQEPGWLADVCCVMIETHDRFRPGCSAAVDSAMTGFNRSQRGETTIYLHA